MTLAKVGDRVIVTDIFGGRRGEYGTLVAKKPLVHWYGAPTRFRFTVKMCSDGALVQAVGVKKAT